MSLPENGASGKGGKAAVYAGRARPVAPEVNVAGIPDDLAAGGRWVAWRFNWRAGKQGEEGAWTKPPLNPHTGKFALPNDPSTAGSFDDAFTYYQAHKSGKDRADGIGFLFTELDPFTGIDLDDALDPATGQLQPWARPLAGLLNSYTEVSPSRTGVKLWVVGSLPPDFAGDKGGRKAKFAGGEVEAYGRLRYFTVTGIRLDGYPASPQPRQEQLEQLLADVFGWQPPRAPADDYSDLDNLGGTFRPQRRLPFAASPRELTDQELLDRAFAAANGAKFKRLWEGDTGAHNGDDSAADQSLCSMLAFWTGKDAERIDRLFRQSGLMREKWERTDYRDRTIKKAIAGCRETFGQNRDGNGRPPTNGHAGPHSTALPGQVQAPAPPAFGEYNFRPITSAEFARTDYRPTWAVKKVLVKNQPAIVGGPKKNLKTSVIVDEVVSLGSGTPFLGLFDVPAKMRVALISGESGPHVLQETARRVCEARGLALADVDVLWDFRLPQLANAAHMDLLRKGLELHKVELLIVDPLYLTLLAGMDGRKIDPSNLFDTGPLFMNITAACLSVGCTPQLAHHAKKNAGLDPIDLDDLAFTGIAEFSRQWLLINRREPFEPGTGSHKLWLQIGGSIGHSSSWALDVEEGVLNDDFTGRKWEVSLTPASELRAREKEEQTDARAEKKRQTILGNVSRILKSLDRLSRGAEPVCLSDVRAAAQLSGDGMKEALMTLTAPPEGPPIVEVVDMPNPKRGKRTVEGIRRLGHPDETLFVRVS